MAKLSPLFNDQTFVPGTNSPASGYQLFTYAAGSSTKQTTFTDSAGSVPQSNPIILNSSGWPTMGPIWLAAGSSTKFVLAPPADTDPPTSPVKTIDNIAGVNDTGAAAVSQWQASGVTPTYVSTTSFTVPGDQTTEFHVGRRAQFTTTAGTVYGIIAATAFSALTTVTMTMDGADVLDAGLSVVNLGILRADHPALPGVSAFALTYLDDTTAAATRTTLGAAESGPNNSITSLTGLTTPLSVAQGGTGGTTAPATSGANSNITSLSGLTTPLSVAQGGTGSATAASGPTIVKFTANGTWTKPAGLKAIRVRQVGGGGASGGGGGGYVEKFIQAASLGTTETVTIGAGGTGIGNGGNTSFGAHCTANGGFGNGGLGGGATGGDVEIAGGKGIASGAPGASMLSAATADATAATNYGGGGGGAATGANGIVIIEQYF